LCPSIFLMSSGVDVVCYGDAVGLVMGLLNLFRSCGGLVGGAVSVEYDARAYFGMFICVICACHVGWTKVEDSVGSLGSLRCGVFGGRSNVVRRVSMQVRSFDSEQSSFLFGSLAINIASVCCM
jgi:hypothetical protein